VGERVRDLKDIDWLLVFACPQDHAMLNISFPRLEWRNASDQIKVERFCNCLQEMVLDRMSTSIIDPDARKDVVVENVARIFGNDWSRFSAVKEPVLLFHLDCSQCCVEQGVDSDKEMKRLFRESVETVSRTDRSWTSEVWKKALLLLDNSGRSSHPNSFFQSQINIDACYIPESENMPGGDRVDMQRQLRVNSQLLDYISYWFFLINKTAEVEDFVMLFADPATKSCIKEGGWSERITIKSGNREKELCVNVQVKLYNPVDETDLSETESSVSNHFTWCLEEIFCKFYGKHAFKFRLLPLPAGCLSRVAVEGLGRDNPGPFVLFHCTYDTERPAPVQDAEHELRKLLNGSNILKYAVYGFKVFLRPAIVHFHNKHGAESQEYVQTCFGFIRTVPSRIRLGSAPGESRPENEAAKTKFSAEQITKLQQELAVVHPRTTSGNHSIACTFFVLESLPGSIVLQAEIPMWLLHIAEDIFKYMDWSSLNLPTPVIDWQKLANFHCLPRAQQQHFSTTDHGRIKGRHKIWKDFSELVCEQCHYTVSLDRPPGSHFYGTTEGLSNLLSCIKTYNCDCLERKRRYLACSVCKTGQEYHDRVSVEFHLLQCRRRVSEASENSLVYDQANSAADSDLLCWLREKLDCKLGGLATVPTVKVIEEGCFIKERRVALLFTHQGCVLPGPHLPTRAITITTSNPVLLPLFDPS
jgi:hypothetical protein